MKATHSDIPARVAEVLPLDRELKVCEVDDVRDVREGRYHSPIGISYLGYLGPWIYPRYSR